MRTLIFAKTLLIAALILGLLITAMDDGAKADGNTDHFSEAVWIDSTPQVLWEYWRNIMVLDEYSDIVPAILMAACGDANQLYSAIENSPNSSAEWNTKLFNDFMARIEISCFAKLEDTVSVTRLEHERLKAISDLESQQIEPQYAKYHALLLEKLRGIHIIDQGWHDSNYTKIMDILIDQYRNQDGAAFIGISNRMLQFVLASPEIFYEEMNKDTAVFNGWLEDLGTACFTAGYGYFDNVTSIVPLENRRKETIRIVEKQKVPKQDLDLKKRLLEKLKSIKARLAG